MTNFEHLEKLLAEKELLAGNLLILYHMNDDYHPEIYKNAILRHQELTHECTYLLEALAQGTLIPEKERFDRHFL